MPAFYQYRKVADQYTTYELQLPQPSEGQAAMLDLGEVAGVTYVCVPDWMLPLPPQPAQVQATLQQFTPTQGLITSLLARSPLLALMQRRISKQEPTPRYSLSDELTLAQVYDWMPPGLMKNVTEGRAWAK
jgi:hypothetical protein